MTTPAVRPSSCNSLPRPSSTQPNRERVLPVPNLRKADRLVDHKLSRERGPQDSTRPHWSTAAGLMAPKTTQTYSFTQVFEPQTDQRAFFEQTAEPLVKVPPSLQALPLSHRWDRCLTFQAVS